MTRITEKKVHTKALHSLLMMKTVTLAMQAEHVTNIATPKGKLSIALLVKEELAQVYFKTTQRFVHFNLLGRESSKPMTPRTQNSSCIGQHECGVVHTYLTCIVQVLCLGDHIHIEVPGPCAL